MKLIALDLDGTLLTTKKVLTDRTLCALERAANTGNWIVPATGRALMALPESITGLPFLRYVISINGASVTDQMTKERIYSADIPKECAFELIEFAKQFDCMYDCYWQDTGWANRSFLDRIRYYNQDAEVIKLILRSRQPVDDLKTDVLDRAETIQKLQLCFRDLDERNAAKEMIRSQFPDIIATSSFRNNLELNWKTADKGRALLILADHLGIAKDHTIAFGDSSNDAAMLKAAGTGVAMANASDELKAICDAVTASNDQDGVAVYLEQHIL